MINGKKIVIEAMKSTFLSIALFTAFDIVIQGYSNYHDWIISAYMLIFSIYYFISRRYLKY